MVNTKKAVVYKADSKMEAESWVDSTGNRKYANGGLEIHREPNGKFFVYKTR